MSFQSIRALVETRVNSAFGALTTPVPVVFDNVGGEPPGSEYVVLSLSYTETTQPVLCQEEAAIEALRGNIQIVAYTARGNGMKRLEELSAVAMTTLNQLNNWALPNPNSVQMRVGQILGPTHVLSGNDPLAVSNVSAPFVAES